MWKRSNVALNWRHSNHVTQVHFVNHESYFPLFKNIGQTFHTNDGNWMVTFLKLTRAESLHATIKREAGCIPFYMTAYILFQNVGQ